MLIPYDCGYSGTDAGAVGRLQHRARPRYRLGSAQATARTLVGTEVPVWARIFTHDDLQEAAENGADGFVIDGPAIFCPGKFPRTNPMEPLLLAFCRLRKPQAEATWPYWPLLDSIDLPSLVRLAAHCRLRVLMAPESLTLSLLELRAELSAVADTEMDTGRLAGIPQFTALLSSTPRAESATDPDEWRGFEETAFLPFDNDEIRQLTLQDILTVPPMFVFLSTTDETELNRDITAALYAGLRGLIVPPSQVSRAKEIIAEQV